MTQDLPNLSRKFRFSLLSGVLTYLEGESPDMPEGYDEFAVIPGFILPPIGKNGQPDHFGPILVDKVNGLVFWVLH